MFISSFCSLTQSSCRFASARRDGIAYLHSEEEILSSYHDNLCLHGRYPAHMAVAMGDSFYYAKFDSFEEGQRFDAFVRTRAK